MSGAAESTPRTFGWQGVEMEVPNDWDLVTHHGNAREGYAYLDDGEQVRLRVRWRREKRAVKELAPVLAQYQRNLRKATRGTAHFEQLDPSFMPQRFHKDKRVVPFFWRTEHAAYGVASHCEICGCTVVAEVLGSDNQAFRKRARSVLATLRDHRDDGLQLWSVYGFAFLVSAEYTLTTPELASGRLAFPFARARGAWLRVERWAVAGQLMRRTPLDAWPREHLKLLGLLTAGDIDVAAEGFRGHDARAFSARVKTWRIGRPKALSGLVWHCPAADKVFVVMADGEADGDLRRTAESVKCPC